jgi:hypothetical protein
MHEVDTKSAPRRDLRIGSLDALRAELDALAAGAAAGTLESTGNWTPGENLDHTSRFMAYAMDGFDVRAPLVIRAIGAITKPLITRMLKNPKPMKPGFKNRGGGRFLEPEPGAELQPGLDRARSCLDRLDAGERFTHPSPLFGHFTHEQWSALQCKHCELHWSFLWPSGAPSDSAPRTG